MMIELLLWSRQNSSVSIVTTLRTGQAGAGAWLPAEANVPPFSIGCIPALGPTQPPIQWISASFSLRKGGQGI
jgi:hypothetical protein